MRHFPRQNDFAASGASAEVHSILEAWSTPVRRPVRIALIGTFAPRRCGIATFTADIVGCASSIPKYRWTSTRSTTRRQRWTIATCRA